MTRTLALFAAVLLAQAAPDPRYNTCTKVVITAADGTVTYTSECPPPVEPDARHAASPS